MGFSPNSCLRVWCHCVCFLYEWQVEACWPQPRLFCSWAAADTGRHRRMGGRDQIWVTTHAVEGHYYWEVGQVASPDYCQKNWRGTPKDPRQRSSWVQFAQQGVHFDYYTSVDNRVMSPQFSREAQFLGQDVQGCIKHTTMLSVFRKVSEVWEPHTLIVTQKLRKILAFLRSCSQLLTF